MEFIFAYLEYIVVGVGTIGTIVFLKTKKISNHSNDLTQLVIRHNKQKASITERTKGVL